jgi:dipeptidyl aminopeptidase/acylaminoacyl peptidase
MDFDWWAAFLASRGYAVVQPNYRGSGGYGLTWENAGHGQWGGLMQTDVEDAIAPLARSGIIDASRVCIVGASYGGYAALAGATLTPDRYKCAVSVAGISDLVEFVTQLEAQEGPESIGSDYERQSIGDRLHDGDHMRAMSPANLAARVQIPILLIHGSNDTVVPIEQSRLMRDRLMEAHKNVRYVELQSDDHWLSKGATRIQMLREVEAFLAQNLAAPVTPH